MPEILQGNDRHHKKKPDMGYPRLGLNTRSGFVCDRNDLLFFLDFSLWHPYT
jgi:hypothetical protein